MFRLWWTPCYSELVFTISAISDKVPKVIIIALTLPYFILWLVKKTHMEMFRLWWTPCYSELVFTISAISDKVPKVIGIALTLPYFILWLVKKTHATVSTNQIQNLSQLVGRVFLRFKPFVIFKSDFSMASCHIFLCSDLRFWSYYTQ